MVVNKSEIYYSMEVTVTFYCALRFERYPVDYQTCYFQVGSYAHDNTLMAFQGRLLSYIESNKIAILDYSIIEINSLPIDKQVYVWQDIGIMSLAGFEIKLKRNMFKYLINFYLPSGLFVIVSWVSYTLCSLF